MTTARTGFRSDQDEDGISLIEIVVSMLILAALAIAFLPLLIQGVKQSASTSTLATASQLVSEKMQVAQSKGPVCADVAALAGSADLTDPRGIILRVVTTTGVCAGNPATINVTTTVTRLDKSVVVAQASTLVYLRS